MNWERESLPWDCFFILFNLRLNSPKAGKRDYWEKEKTSIIQESQGE
jgi:hypothetical protein